MDITFEGKCPQCKQEIVIHIVAKTEEERQVSKEVKDMEAYTFDLMKQASQDACKEHKGVSPFFMDIFGKLESLSRPEDYINRYFDRLEKQVNSIKDLQKLTEKRKELAKIKVEVNKNLRKGVESRKKKLLALIEKKLKSAKKGGKNRKV